MFLRLSIQSFTRKFYFSRTYRRTMEVFPISALGDNYMYVLQDTSSDVCAVVDPVEPKKVVEFLLL